MSTALKFPPSHRDFQVHRFLAVEGGSTREAAVRFGVSQTRVRQLARRVVQWAAETLPPEVEAELAGLMRVAESVAADRLEHHYQETMEQWRAHHQPKFLNLALRVTMASAKFPRRSYEIEAAAADLLEGPEGGEEEPSARSQEPGTLYAAPPDRDCSGEKRSGVSAPSPIVASRYLSPRPASKLGVLLAGDVNPEQALESRVRTLLAPPDKATIAQLGVTAESLGLNVDDVLQRSQRRNRKAK